MSQVTEEDVKHRLTHRYGLAVFLIACVLVASYLVINTQIRGSEQDAYVINISGMQRMLSQRIGLLVNELRHVNDEQSGDAYAAELLVVVERMESNHQQLTSGKLSQGREYKLSSEIYDLYYGRLGMYDRVRSFTDLARQVLNQYNTIGREALQIDESAALIVKIARDGDLLRDLDLVVQQYEHDADAKIATFQMFENLILALGLFTLLMEVIFIFRPMVRQIVVNMADLNAANEELTEFSYRISHDVRAPVISSLGMVSLCEHSLEQKDYNTLGVSVTHIHKQLTKMEALIDDISNLMKARATDIAPEAVGLEDMVRSTFERFSNLAHYERLDIRLEIDVKKPILVQRILLQQTMDNLISNAIKYQDLEKEDAFIMVRASREGSDIAIEVIDNGLGIPEDCRKDMFGMFKRFHPKQSFGSGLGLYLVAQNVKFMQGEITYDALNDGSAFVLRLPCVDA